jgi:hypothetical protein
MLDRVGFEETALPGASSPQASELLARLGRALNGQHAHGGALLVGDAKLPLGSGPEPAVGLRQQLAGERHQRRAGLGRSGKNNAVLVLLRKLAALDVEEVSRHRPTFPPRR